MQLSKTQIKALINILKYLSYQPQNHFVNFAQAPVIRALRQQSKIISSWKSKNKNLSKNNSFLIKEV
ncbi:hypothetical protein RLOatenuis_7800 [Rickettsiales bacterium]|nr:hypothetical protein RLOatenuis_7800 [Rickettsiales bacterium]